MRSCVAKSWAAKGIGECGFVRSEQVIDYCGRAGGEALVTLDVGDEYAGFVEVGVEVLGYWNWRGWRKRVWWCLILLFAAVSLRWNSCA